MAATGKRKLAVLGCGTGQVAFINEIKALDFYIAGFDARTTAEALRSCDEQHLADIRSVEAVARAMKEGFDGIVTTTEVALETCAALAERYGLPGFQTKIVRVFRDKLAFCRLLKSLRLACPSFAEIQNPGDIADFRAGHGTRVVCKPVDSSASRGVTITQSRGEDEEAFSRAMAASRKGKVLVQSYISGTEHGVECFISEGRCRLIATTDKFTSGLPSCVVLGHRMPSVMHDELQYLVLPMVERITGELGITRAQMNFDVVHGGRQAVIIDAGLRPGGNYLQELVSHCYEFNPWKFYISIFCHGLDQAIPGNATGYAGCRFILPRQAGRFDGLATEQGGGDNLKIHLLKKKGDIIHRSDCAENRVAAAVASGTSSEHVDRLLSGFASSSIVNLA